MDTLLKSEKVVNFIALGWSSCDAPFNSGDRWGLNCSYIYGKLDRVFWMHKPGYIPTTLRLGKDSQKIQEVIATYPDMEIMALDEMLIEEYKGEVYFNTNVDSPGNGTKVLKKTLRYPRDEAAEMIGGYYFTNTIPYMIALAILEGYDRIRMYGVETFTGIQDGEYKFERECIQDWIMFAKGRGLSVEMPFLNLVTASNGTNNLYGYNSESYGRKRF